MLLAVLVFLLNTATSTLVGRVTDNSGRPVPKADVRLLLADGTIRPAATDDHGSFRFSISGRFQIEIGKAGFRSIQTAVAVLPSDGLYEVAISMYAGDTSRVDQVELRISEPREMANRADPSAREALPKSDRLFGFKGGVNVSGIKEGSGQQWIAASGNVFTSSSMAFVSSSADFSADLGDSSVVDDALPTGSAAFHGNLHAFHRNERLNARNFFDLANAPTPPFKYNFFGGDMGGRLREGTFFYGQYWGLRIGQSITRAATLPDPAWLEGDFSKLTETLLDPETGFPFAGNRIPKERFARSAGYALAKLYPLSNVANGSVRDYRAVARLRTAADAFGFRVDHRVSPADEAFVEYQFNRDTTDDPFNLLSGITNLPFFGVRDALQTHSFRLNNTHVFSPTLVHQLRLSFNSLDQPRSILESTAQPAVIITGMSYLGHATNLPQQRRNRSYELLNDFAWQRKGSSTKAGVELRYFPFHASMDLYSRGQFQFTGNVFAGHPFANLLLGLPTNALRIQGNTSREFRSWMGSLYLQHDVQLSPSLSLNAGVRYDYQSPYRVTYRLAATFDASTGEMIASPKRLYNPDRNNVSPRLGLAWQPPIRNTMVRAGYGIFYDTLAVGDSLFLLGLNPPYVRFDLENNGPVVPLFTLDTVFADSAEAIHPSVFSISKNLPNPYVQQWNLALERQLPWAVSLEAGYYGQKGTRLRRQLNLNQPTPGPIGTLDDRRPFPGFRNIFQFETSASSIAHAADLHLSRRFGSDSSIDASYRFSRLIDDATLISVLPQDSHNLRGERGLADFHMKHRFTFQGTVGPVKGWQLAFTGMAQSGTPLSAVLGADVAGTGSPIVNRPDLLRDPNVPNPSAARFFDPAAFRVPETGTFGNSGRNTIIGPGIQNVDLALSRAFRVSDFTRLQFRADMYNVLNHPNFVAPPSMQNFADSSDFGQLFVARSPRILQFGLKFLW